MREFLKEWRGVIVLAVILLTLIAIFAVYANTTFAAHSAICEQSAQRFTPPLDWRWNPWGVGNGCELRMSGTWYPADIVFPSLEMNP